jgi:hypothetical protein
MTLTTARPRLARAALAGLLALSAAGTTGCFGKFSLTRKLYTWNASVGGNKWVSNLVFWGLCIIPVYQLAGLGDAVVLNAVEFWTGTNPVADARDVQTRELPGGAVEIAYGGDTFLLVPTGEGAFEVARDGEPIGYARVRPDGSLVVTSPRGTTEIHPGGDPGAIAQRF